MKKLSIQISVLAIALIVTASVFAQSPAEATRQRRMSPEDAQQNADAEQR